MYQFNKIQNSDGTWRLELDGIKLIVDGFEIERDAHKIKNPEKAIAFFEMDGRVYGFSNQYKFYSTAEDFYEIMQEQHKFFENVA